MLQDQTPNAQSVVPTAQRRRPLCHVLVIVVSLCFLAACPLQIKPLRPYPPPPTSSSAIYLKIRWFRTTFNNYYQLERQLATPQDRLRRLIRQYSQIAVLTYHNNRAYINKRQRKNKRLDNLAHFYLLMNLMIRETIAIPSPTSNRPIPRKPTPPS